MKISRTEGAVLLLCACFASFCLGWFLRGGSAGPVRVEVQRPAAEAAVVIPPSAAAPAATAGAPEEKVNINTADAAALEALPGIGEKRAADIVAYRAQHGPFRIPEDLTRVKGIGEGILEGLLDYITVGEDTR